MDIKEFIIKNVEDHPRDIVNLAMGQFDVSRVAVLKHLNALIREGKIVAEGRTRNRIYFLLTKNKAHFCFPVTPNLDESLLWNERLKPLAAHLPKNVFEICEYGFTEMVNNVIDHSRAKNLKIDCDFSGKNLQIIICDDGVGIFQKIKSALHLETYREAVLHLSKGKITTDPEYHTGEGIFFTSRVFDTFSISANGLVYKRFENDDWLLDENEIQKGTSVIMTMQTNSLKKAGDVFKQYSVPESEYSFSKTKIVVALGLIPGETYISRSQAKRILFGLDKFKEIVFDFRKVETVGQGFVDAVFRIFQNNHPDIRISFVHANENVEFMIKRSLTTARSAL